MLQVMKQVKFMGYVEEKKSKDGREWTQKEAILFIDEVGRVSVPVYDKLGPCSFPEAGQNVNLMLSCEIGPFKSLKVVWDHETRFKALALAKAA